jgi:hypothetical protein
MRRFDLFCFGLLLFTIPAGGQESKQNFQVPAPNGWGKETITLPPAFAKNMSWKGVEELRFAPGMFKAESDTFFSYGILFWLPGDAKVDEKTVEQELLAYYRGLAKAVGKNKELDVGAFSINLKESTDKKGKRPTGEPYSSFTGELKWVEPFVTRQPQTLRLDLQIWYCEKHKHHCLFLCVSPLPDDAAVWKTLREIRDGCKY